MPQNLIPAKHIVRNCISNRGYIAHEYAMDIYRGCNHGCIYCYARSSYYEKTEDFTCIRVKEDALRIVRDDLRRKTRKGIVLNGCLTDPYNALERELKLTRHVLELLQAFEFGFSLISKSDLVVRDIDVLQDIKENAPVGINFSITCSDDEMSSKVEPGAPVTSKRFDAIRQLSKSGITTGVLMDPILPYINDTEENVVTMVKMAKDAGASYMYLSPMVTMADIQREYFYEQIDRLFPGVSETYREKYKNYYRCRSPKGRKLYKTFVETCEKEGLCYDMRAANQRLRLGYKMFEMNFNDLT